MAAGWALVFAGFVVHVVVVTYAQELPFPLNHVDPRIGTSSVGWGLGQNNPSAQYPFGALRLGPDTSYDNFHPQFSFFGGYNYKASHIQAFSHTHVVGAGLPDFGNFGFMALRRARPTAVDISRHGYRSVFSHTTEIMMPSYYAVFLETHQTNAELTAAGTFAGVHRYTYRPGEGAATLLIDICHSVKNGDVACPEASANISFVGDTIVIDGAIRNFGSLTDRNGKGTWIYLHARVTATSARQEWGLWAAGRVLPGQLSLISETSQSLGAYINFGNASSTITVTAEVGISFISPSLALKNLDAQIKGRSFDAVKADTTQLWTDLLGSKIQATASRESDLTKLYTALYRTYMSPTNYVESDGTYLGMDEQVHQIENGRGYYSDLSLWDTYRTQNPWLGFVQSDVAEDIINSIALMISQGDGLPRWPIVNIFTSCMFGDNANMIILDAYRKGLRRFDINVCYEAMKSNAIGPRPRDGRGNIEAYIAYGFIPLDISETGTPQTLAYAYNDWAIAELASLLNNPSDEEYFRKRSHAYEVIFNQEQLLMCPRYINGTWSCPEFPARPYDPNYIEGNAYQYTWDVPHDLDRFVSLWPSPEAFVDKLDMIMNKSTVGSVIFTDGWLPPPYYWQGNEHDLLFPWEFSMAGRVDKTQYWTRWILEHSYSDQPSGLPGNDDYGTMSAWYTFGALGLYPVTGAEWYFIGSPVVDKATIQLENGQTLTISTINNSPSNVFVESVTLNGLPLTEPFITHDKLTNGATLSFTMSNTPNTTFNTAYANAWKAKHRNQRKV